MNWAAGQTERNAALEGDRDRQSSAVGSVAVVLVSTDEGHLLIKALESLDTAPPARPTEVVVIDNGSRDGAREEIARRWPRVRVLVRERRWWLPANLNLGIASTTAPVIMLCNSDIIIRPGAIDRLAGFLDEHPAAGIAGPNLVSLEGEPRRAARRWFTLRSLVVLRWPWVKEPMRFPSVQASVYAEWDRAEPRMVDWVPCPATMVRRDAIADVGRIDERFRRYFDDVDLCLRMHERGWQVWCVPEAVVVHLERRASLRPLSRAWFRHLESLLRFAWKHKGLRPRAQRLVLREAAAHREGCDNTSKALSR